MNEFKDKLAPIEIKHFLTLPGENLIIAKRQHWIVLVAPISLAVILMLLTLPLGYFLFVFYLADVFLFIASVFVTMIMITTFIVHILIDWSFHLYIITDRKILEMKFVPIFSQVISDVFLDQVRTTEVDIKIDNFIHELLNVGDVTISFDRPSHEDTFTLKDIKNPRDTGVFITDAIASIMHETPIWFHPRDISNIARHEDIVSNTNQGK